ncbi:hypothetical protein EC988_001586, partial [Linderina pennispora]
MNLSGLSYLQFLLVDAFVTLYLFWRIHETGSWSAINPLSASRVKRQERIESAARMLAYYFCLIAMALFMGRDGIMAAQELQDVDLCRASVYLGQQVAPLDVPQQPGIRQGLRLWTFGMAFLFLALGLVMLNWSSHSVKQVLGDNSPLGDVPGKALAGFGLASFIFTIVAHFVAYGKEDDMARARSN